MKEGMLFEKKNLFITVYCFLAVLFTYSAQPEEISIAKAEPSWVEQINDLHLSSFNDREVEAWETDDYMQYIGKILDLRKNPKPYTKRRAATKIQKSLSEDSYGVLSNITTCKNLELVRGSHSLDYHLLSCIDRTKSEVGRMVLMHMIANPTEDKAILSHRTQALRYLYERQGLLYKLTEQFEKIASVENVLLGFWDVWDPFRTAMGRCLFREGKSILNDHTWALEAKSWWEHQMRLVHTGMSCFTTILLAYHGLRLMVSDDRPEYQNWCNPERYVGHGGPLGLLWGCGGSGIEAGISLGIAAYTASTIKDNVEWTYACFYLENSIQALLVDVASYMGAIKEIEKLLNFDSSCSDRFPLYRKMLLCRDMYGTASERFKEFLDLIQEPSFQEGSSWASRGRILRAYFLASKIKEELTELLTAIGQVDAYCSIVRLYLEHEDKLVKYCFAEFDYDQPFEMGPFIKAEGLWNPFVDDACAVTNDAQIGGSYCNNIILTGPNSGGKSTFLRSVGIAQVLAQSIGLVPASRYNSTPIHSIETYMSVTDDTSQGQSLFKAEVARAQELVEKMKNLDEQEKFGLVLCDEMLSGTNPVEGAWAAYSVAELLGAHNNALTLIATHFKELTELEEKTGNFVNWNVSVVKHDDGSIDYPFKLGYGPSNQHVALDIMRLAGFHGEVVTRSLCLLQEYKEK